VGELFSPTLLKTTGPTCPNYINKMSRMFLLKPTTNGIPANSLGVQEQVRKVGSGDGIRTRLTELMRLRRSPDLPAITTSQSTIPLLVCSFQEHHQTEL